RSPESIAPAPADIDSGLAASRRLGMSGSGTNRGSVDLGSVCRGSLSGARFRPCRRRPVCGRVPGSRRLHRNRIRGLRLGGPILRRKARGRERLLVEMGGHLVAFLGGVVVAVLGGKKEPLVGF